MNRTSVVISDFYMERISFFPNETNPPLIVYPDAVLARPFLLKSFEMVAPVNRKHPKVRRSIEHQEFAASHPLDRLKSEYGLIVEYRFGLQGPERAYRHYAQDMMCCVKRQALCWT